MLKPQGVATLTSPEGVKEADTFTCHHCNAITHVKAKADPAELGGLCKHCMKLICKNCVGKGCTPFLEKLDRFEKRLLARKSMGL